MFSVLWLLNRSSNTMSRFLNTVQDLMTHQSLLEVKQTRIRDIIVLQVCAMTTHSLDRPSCLQFCTPYVRWRVIHFP